MQNIDIVNVPCWQNIDIVNVLHGVHALHHLLMPIGNHALHDLEVPSLLAVKTRKTRAKSK